MSDPRIVLALTRSRGLRRALLGALVAALLLPVLAGERDRRRPQRQRRNAVPTRRSAERSGGRRARSAQGLFARRFGCSPGAAYEVGATEYGGPGDPSSGNYGSIPDPGQSYLPAHPDTFAELSVLDRNPANGGAFTLRRRRTRSPSCRT